MLTGEIKMQKTFGSFLKEKRQEKNITQKDLAELLFVSDSAISKWEKDVARPDISLLPKLAQTLGVTEHELITASIDTKSREEKSQAKKWRIFSTTFDLFFYISYIVALIPCFICNLAINKTLSWFFIVLSALILSFSFTNLPKLIKKHKLIFVPLSNYIALCILLATCAIYSKGSWFLIAAFSVLLGLIIIFTPIYISKYQVFSKIKKYNAFVSIAVDLFALNILLIIIDLYSPASSWYFAFGLPITFAIFLILNVFLCVRFLKTNNFIKTGVILSLGNFFVYILPQFIKVDNKALQAEIDDLNIFAADFSKWQTSLIEKNVHCIIFLTILCLAIIFFAVGLILRFRKNKNID